MGNIVQFKGNTLPSFLVADDGVDNSEFTHGAGEGFGVLSLRGKIWRLKHKGEERILTKEGDPITRLNAVLLRANANYSKLFYAKKYTEGDDAAPDCFSNDGVKPDPSVQVPQCKTCEACPNNVWGSRINDAGKKAKACQDSRRIAVLLADPKLDITTDEPVLLRVPPASLGELKTYGDGLTKSGIAIWKIISQLSFDTEAAYPKIMFKAFGWDETQVLHWKELRDSDTTSRILEAPEVAGPQRTAAPSPVRAPTVDASDDGEDDDDSDDVAPPPLPVSKAKETPPSKPKKVVAKPKKEVEQKSVDTDDVVNVDDVDTDDLVNQLLGD